MATQLRRIFTRSMSTGPTSHLITLPNRPVVQPSGEVQSSPLTLNYWEWKGQKPTVLFCHAASFHARCYDRIINEALRGFHVIALDSRGHGRSQQHPPPYHFRWFGGDVLAFIEQMNLDNGDLIGIGHSFGGYALTWAAASASRRLFQSLLLIDPVILPPVFYENFDENNFPAEYIRRRKSQWTSVEEMVARLEKRLPFSRWPKDTLLNYCTYAVDENIRLRCTPDGEASIYQFSTHPESNIYPLIKKSKFIHEIPVHIVRAEVPFSTGQFDESPTEPDLYKYFKNVRDTKLESGGHLFPMDQPEIAIDLVKDLVKDHRKLSSHL